MRYRTLKAKYATPFRKAVVDQPTAELGQTMLMQRQRIEDASSQAAKRLTKVRTLGRSLNMIISPAAARRPETAPALKRLNELLNEDEPA